MALMLVGPSKWLKQIIQIELDRVKNPNWPEENQLAIYKNGRGFELGTTVNKSSERSERDLNSKLASFLNWEFLELGNDLLLKGC